MRKFIDIFFPFINKTCVYCGTKFSFFRSLFLKGHTITGVRYLACKNCNKVNYDFYEGYLSLLDEDKEKFTIGLLLGK